MSEPRVKYYEGTRPDGTHHQSLYPKLFRVRYKRFFAGRLRDVERIEGGHSDVDVRRHIILRDPHGEIRDPIEVEHLMDLAPVYEGSITDCLR
jgi:hypothetical protein